MDLFPRVAERTDPGIPVVVWAGELVGLHRGHQREAHDAEPVGGAVLGVPERLALLQVGRRHVPVPACRGGGELRAPGYPAAAAAHPIITQQQRKDGTMHSPKEDVRGH